MAIARVLVAAPAFAALVGCGAFSGGGEAPRRIVAVAPSAVEILFELGLGERVVGVGDFAHWPPGAEGLPRLGGLFGAQLETIVALQPDLAVLLPSEAELGGQLRRLDIEVLTVASESLADTEAAILAIADRCGVSDRGRELLGEWRAGLEPAAAGTGPSVAMIVGRQRGDLTGLVVPGPGTFLDEVLAMTGARNAFADASGAYPQVGLDSLLRRQPDIIVELQPDTLPEWRRDRLLADWGDLPELDAVAAGCVRVVDGSHVLVPGPRLPQLYRELVAATAPCPPA